MEIKRGLIETEPVGKDEVEGISIKDDCKHAYHRILHGGFTYCVRPLREYGSPSNSDKNIYSEQDLIGRCETCSKHARKYL